MKTSFYLTISIAFGGVSSKNSTDNFFWGQADSKLLTNFLACHEKQKIQMRYKTAQFNSLKQDVFYENVCRNRVNQQFDLICYKINLRK